MIAAAIDAFWDECCRALPAATAGRHYRLLSFGTDPVVARRIIDLIIAGEKTGTFAADWIYEDCPQERPAAGDLRIVTDPAGAPAALVRITHTECLPFSELTAAHIACEGPALRDLELWRKVHWDYWQRTLAPLGRTPAADMPVLCQRFERLYAVAAPRYM